MATTLFNKTALANGTSNLNVRADALNHSTDLVQAGVVFNDAVRASTGLFSLSGSGNQNPFLGSYTTDIHAVQNDIAAMLATPAGVTLGGQVFTLNTTDTAVLTNIQSQLGTLLTAAPQTTNAATLTAADQTLHAVQSEILQEINNDPHIAAALNNVQFMATTGANDVAFQNTPAGADDPAALAAATAGTSLKAVGEVFNAAADLALGGISAANLGQVTTDFTAVQQGLTAIVNNQTMLAQIEAGETANAAALTTIHLQTALGQIGLQLNKYDGAEANGSATGLRGTADNLLDIIDIIQGDGNLNTAAGGNGAAGHAGGFAEMPGGLSGTVTHFQDNQAQTNFWAAFLSEANTINAHLTAISNGQEQATSALVTQIQNYQQFGANFDAAQGSIFQARFDNELLHGTLEADTANAVKGLTGILNGDTGAALAADNAMINAAGQGFAADAMDVSGNNTPIGGGTYVGTATTVATATSVNGLAQGTIPVTATPNIANGTGGSMSSPPATSGNPSPAATTLFNKTALANGTSHLNVRADALNHSTDLVQAGVVFNDAVRASTGLFSLSGSGNQNPFLGSYTTDIHAVQNDIAAMLATPAGVTLGGQAFTLNTTDTAVLTNIQSQLGTLLTAAPQTTNAATLTAADQTLHAVQSEILQEINNDPHIAAALNNVQFMATTGANDVAFQNTPAGADDPAALAAATAGTSLKAVGEVFNAAADLALGGISAANLGQVTTDFTAVQQGLTAIVNNQTMLAQIEAGETANAAALTTIHLQTALGQIGLQLNKYDGAEANGSATGLRGTADNLLDIIDIIQGDGNLNTAAGGNGAAGHAGGFSEMPGGLSGTVTHFQDNQPQTNFWAAFLSEANTINAHLTAISNGTEQATSALVTQIQNYQQFGANFDAAQGSIFQARFDNELLHGTLEADTANAVKGLTGILNGDTGAALAADNAMINAAGQGFAADAMDVSGNNTPIGGGTYVGTATTVATATSVNGLAQGTIPVTATPNIANGTGGSMSSPPVTGGNPPPAATTLFNHTALANGTSHLIVRADALNQSSDLVQAGVVFNDAVRLSTGLFNLSGSGNQSPFLGEYTADIHAVQNDIAAILGTPGNATLGGQAFALNTTDTAVLTNIQSQLGTLLTAAPQTTNAATLTAADQTLHAVQTEILQEINNDPHIAAVLNNVQFLANTGANDVAFQNTPAGADDPAALAAATAGTSLKAVGEVFNAAADLALGGISAANLGQVTTDFTAVQQGLTAIVNNQTMLAQIEAGETANAAALTTIHLQTALGQIGLQLNKYDGAEANGSATGLRGTADNLLDIIDIIQGDGNLNTAAGGNGAAGHAGGFSEMPGGLTGSVTHFQDNQPQTNFWAAFLSEANTINTHLTAISNGTEQATSALVTQIQNYQQFGANFDAAQGSIFQARFDNELLHGTLEADTANAVKGLTGILNGDTGAALAADNAMINAAGQGFAADAMDVSGNNTPIGGGTYVGTATTVATATSMNGLAQGSIPVTATPNIANGTGGTASSPPVNSPPGGDNGGNGGTPPGGDGGGGGGTPPGGDGGVAHLNPGDLYFENMFNDATRILEGGLWHNNAPVGNQGNGTDGRYIGDLQLVQTGLTADVAANDFSGVQLTDVNKVLGDITTALNSVPGAVNNDAGAEAALRAAHLDIINTVENDAVLQAISIKDGNPGFNFAPPELATPLNANTPQATFAELGAIFDDAQSKSLGGINADNLPAIQADLQTVHDGLLTLMKDHPQLFQGATGIHASTIVDQINLQLTNFDHQYGFNPDAAKATNDNFLDITDIVAGDANLTNMASANGVAGWTGAPATDVVPVPYQDNADQTNFWADFIASGNTLGAQAEQLVSTGSAQDIKAFVHTLQGWEHNIQNFDAAQGGIFEARFDNELLGKNSTVGADVAAMIKGLETHNAALVKAAADGFHANAADVSGNNVPLNGGTFNADGTTIADALSTATGPLPPAPVSLLTPTAPAAPAAPAVDHSAGADPSAFDPHQLQFAELAHHLHHQHMWN